MRDNDAASPEMSDNKLAYLVYESSMARMERTIRRCFITMFLLIALLLATNVGWLIYESQFETEAVQIEAEQDGDNNSVVGGNYYGQAESQNYKDNKEEN